MLDVKMGSGHRNIEVTPSGRLEVIDLTDELRSAVKDSGITEGFVVAFCAHTTCTLILNELEEGALEDLRRRLDQLVPGDVYYGHDDIERRRQNVQERHERPNGRAHVAQVVLGGSSHTIPVIGGELALGRWQRLLLLELDEPKKRRVVFQTFG